MESSIVTSTVVRVGEQGALPNQDHLVVEEPLGIRVGFMLNGANQNIPVSVTMRTPGQDSELAAGFLFTENIIQGRHEISGIEQDDLNQNITIRLCEDTIPDIERLKRHFYTSSSCGICGKSTIDQVRTKLPLYAIQPSWQTSPEVLYSLIAKLSRQQERFLKTGGLHASALFDSDGQLLVIREDVGRHNALDKVIGFSLQADLLPLNRHILLLSGRASFELIQKAAMGGISLVAAIGAPSSLAVELAEECGVTLIGFLKNNRFNIYSCPEKLIKT